MIVDQDIRRLDVAVKKVFGVGVVHRVGKSAATRRADSANAGRAALSREARSPPLTNIETT